MTDASSPLKGSPNKFSAFDLKIGAGSAVFAAFVACLVPIGGQHGSKGTSSSAGQIASRPSPVLESALTAVPPVSQPSAPASGATAIVLALNLGHTVLLSPRQLALAPPLGSALGKLEPKKARRGRLANDIAQRRAESPCPIALAKSPGPGCITSSHTTVEVQ